MPKSVRKSAGRAVSSGAMQSRIEDVSAQLRRSLREVINALPDRPTRPSALTRQLELNKNLASRIMASLRDTDALSSLARLPAPEGLRIFLAKAAERGVPQRVLERGHSAADAFHRLMDEAGGRSALDAMISGWVPETRIGGENLAKQQIFKSLGFVLGYLQDVELMLQIVQPSSSDASKCDVVAVMGKFELRRIRTGATILLGGGRFAASGESGPSIQPLTRDGGANMLLPRFSSSPAPKLQTLEQGGTVYHYLPAGPETPVGQGLNLVFGYRGVASIPRKRDDRRREIPFTAMMRTPTRLLIHDVFVREDVWPPTLPRLTAGVHRPGDQGPAGSSAEVLDKVDVLERVELLGNGVASVISRDVPNHSAIIKFAFDALGAAPEQFRGYRMRILHPIQFMCYTTWLDLA